MLDVKNAIITYKLYKFKYNFKEGLSPNLRGQIVRRPGSV